MTDKIEVSDDPTPCHEYVCPKCYHPFEALFAYWRHMREVHGEPYGKA